MCCLKNIEELFVLSFCPFSAGNSEDVGQVYGTMHDPVAPLPTSLLL